MKKKKEALPSFKPSREYKFDRAMNEAAKKAKAIQPALISMVSNVKDFQYEK